MNDDTYLDELTRFIAGSYFHAVPVFPAVEYASDRAFFPVPVSTTWRSICLIPAAASSLITRVFSGFVAEIIVSSDLLFSLITCGCTRTPLFAIVAKAVVICNGDT